MTRNERTRVNLEALRLLRRGYRCGKPTESSHRRRRRDQDHPNMERTLTTQRDGGIKKQKTEKTGDTKRKDRHTTQIDTISIQFANKGPLAMTAIIVMKVRVMAAGGKRKAILQGGGGHTDIEVGTGATGLGTQSTAVVPHKTTIKTLATHMLRAK